MPRSHYLHVRIPGRGRITLSLPRGVERAIVSGRLPADAEVWHSALDIWLPLTRHPGVRRLLRIAALDRQPHQPVREAVPAQPADPAQLPLIPLENFEPHGEFIRFLELSSAAEERRRVVRTSGPLRPSGPARTFVAGDLELRPRLQPSRRLQARYQVPGWAAMAAVLVLVVGAVGLYFLGWATGHNQLPIPVTVTNGLSARWETPYDSSASLAALVEPNPLAAEERELENNLRIAEVVVWQPAIDFQPDQLLRSSRKLDAVRNSISLYRIGAWRLIDSTVRDEDPRLESYDEANRVDEVLSLMQSAITLLDAQADRFRVSGTMLIFSDSTQADRYRWLRQRADSLLRAPLDGDSLPVPRAPRRVVTRLMATLPGAVTADR